MLSKNQESFINNDADEQQIILSVLGYDIYISMNSTMNGLYINLLIEYYISLNIGVFVFLCCYINGVFNSMLLFHLLLTYSY